MNRIRLPSWLDTPRARLGAGLLAGFLLVALVGPWCVGDPSASAAMPLSEPSWAHPFGTTGQGQDVLAQTVAGTRASLLGGLLIGLLVVAVGALVGVTAAFAGGKVDGALSLLTNVLLVVPSLPLAIVAAAWLPPGPMTIGAVLVATGWAWNARVVRMQALSLAAREYVLAARVAGESGWRIVVVELLPNLGSLLVAQLIGATTWAIGAQVGLEFLGLGEVGRMTWGANLYWAANDQALLTGAWWTFLPTGLSIALTAFALALLAGAVDEALTPALRAGRDWRRLLPRGMADAEEATPVVRS